MTLPRIAGIHAAAGALAAVAGWALAEAMGPSLGAVWRMFGEATALGLVGAAVGGTVGGLAGTRGSSLRARLGPITAGVVTGGLVGVVGASLGRFLIGVGITTRANEVGATLLGAGIGLAEGLYLRDPRRLRRGLVAGALAGLGAGLLGEALGRWSGSEGRAAPFAVLGATVAATAGLSRLVLARGWLAFGDGRREPLGSSPLILGRAGGPGLGVAPRQDAEAQPKHTRIVLRPDGRYFVEDLGTRGGTWVNQRRISGATLLDDGDLIGIGSASVQFQTRWRPAASPAPAPTASPAPAPAATRSSTPPPAPASAPPVRPTTPPVRPTTQPAAQPNPTAARPPISSLADLSPPPARETTNRAPARPNPPPSSPRPAPIPASPGPGSTTPPAAGQPPGNARTNPPADRKAAPARARRCPQCNGMVPGNATACHVCGKPM